MWMIFLVWMAIMAVLIFGLLYRPMGEGDRRAIRNARAFGMTDEQISRMSG